VSRLLLASLALSAVVAVASFAPLPDRSASEPFLVQEGEKGIAFLGPDGQEVRRLDGYASNGAFSPDGQTLACVEFDRAVGRSKLVLRSQGGKGEPVFLSLVFGQLGTASTLVWSADGGRLVIGETGLTKTGAVQYAHRIYNLTTKKFTDVKLPQRYSVTGWSRDCKQFLITDHTDETIRRIAWLNADGTGKPDFLTSEDEYAYDACLARDGRKVLFAAGPKPAKGQRLRVRLYVMDLATKKRVAVDEPGDTIGYCWSPDGFRVAYTWQRPMERPEEVPLRETLLITCDLDGGNRKVVTRRLLEVEANKNIVIYFWVLDWR
jgi:dipeptidyl aminopeptidase/acylaminoacyl peptidase